MVRCGESPRNATVSVRTPVAGYFRLIPKITVMKEESKIQIRRMKVSHLTQVRNQNLLYHRQYITVPSLLIAGKWFEKAGFTVSSPVDVMVSEGELIIKKVNS